MVSLTQTAGDNARQTLMTFRQEDYQNCIFHHGSGFYLFDGFFYSLCGHLLAALVQILQITCQHSCFLSGLCQQQLKGTLCRIQSSRGIQTRTEDESDMIRTDILRFETIYPD